MILVIGATGYIGRYFCTEMVNRGEDVLALGRSSQVFRFLQENHVRCQHFDFNEPDCFASVPAENVEAIVDLSAKLAEIETPVEDFFSVNTIGAYKTLEFARRTGIKKVIISSTHKVYNDIQKERISETDEVCFTGDHSPYIISKIAAENFVEYYNKDFDMNAIALRLTGVHGYGEILGQLKEDGSYHKSAFELFFEKALKGEPITVWGNQTIRRDHIYIKDVVSALLAAVRSRESRGIFNIASGVGHTQFEEAQVLARVFGVDGRHSTVSVEPEKPGLTRGYIYDISKARRELHWEPHYTDLTELYEDYRQEWLSKKYHNYHFIREDQKPATL